MASVQANGITIEYETHGSGDPVVLIMGLGGQLTDWTPEFVDGLAQRGHHVIRFDNRDIGLSTAFDWTPPSQAQTIRDFVLRRRPPADYVIDDMAADAVGLLDALGLASAHFVGLSMGGMIAQAVAISHPHRVRSLTSIMSNTGDGRRGRPSVKLLIEIGRMGQPTPDDALEYSTRVFELISGPHFDPVAYRAKARLSLERSYRPEGVARQAAAIAGSPDRTHALGRVTAPTLVIHGLEDRLVKPSGGLATAAAVRDSRLLMFPDMGHDIPEPRREEILDAIAANAARAHRRRAAVAALGVD